MNEKWPEWVVSYEFEGSKWGLNIIAPDAKEAARRLRAIGMTGSIDGQLIERVPAVPGAGLYVRIKTACNNLLRS